MLQAAAASSLSTSCWGNKLVVSLIPPPLTQQGTRGKCTHADVKSNIQSERTTLAENDITISSRFLLSFFLSLSRCCCCFANICRHSPLLLFRECSAADHSHLCALLITREDEVPLCRMSPQRSGEILCNRSIDPCEKVRGDRNKLIRGETGDSARFLSLLTQRGNERCHWSMRTMTCIRTERERETFFQLPAEKIFLDRTTRKQQMDATIKTNASLRMLFSFSTGQKANNAVLKKSIN